MDNDTSRYTADEAEAGAAMDLSAGQGEGQGEPPVGSERLTSSVKCRPCLGRGHGYRIGQLERTECDKCGGTGRVDG